MPKLKKRIVTYYSFYCVGCKHQHSYTVFDDNTGWQFNGNLDSPSFTPSLLNVAKELNEKTGVYDIEKSRCHLFVTNGKIIYCGDCTHELSGNTVDMQNVA